MLFYQHVQAMHQNGKQSGTNGNPTVTDKTVVYTCNKKTVTAVYQFENQEPTAAMVMVGNKVIAKDFARDAAQKRLHFIYFRKICLERR